MATRARGDGSLFYDEADRLWIGRIDLGRDADGKRRRRTVKAKTKTEAAKKLREIRTGVERRHAAAWRARVLTTYS